MVKKASKIDGTTMCVFPSVDIPHFNCCSVLKRIKIISIAEDNFSRECWEQINQDRS